MFVEIDAVLRHERDALAAQPLLHDPGRFEVTFAREHPVAIHHAVAGQVGAHRLVEGPPDRPGRPTTPEVLGDIAVGSNAARGDLGDDGPDALEEGSLFVRLNGHGEKPASLTEYSEGTGKIVVGP